MRRMNRMAKAPELTLAYEELCELARHDPAHGPEKFVSKFVSKTAQKAGFAGFAGL
jgi:hypothetical protein